MALSLLSLLSVPYIVFKASLNVFVIVTAGPQCTGCLLFLRGKTLSLQLVFPGALHYRYLKYFSDAHSVKGDKKNSLPFELKYLNSKNTHV